MKVFMDRNEKAFEEADKDGNGIVQWEAYFKIATDVHNKAIEVDGFIAADLIEEEIKELFELHSRASGNEAGVTYAGVMHAAA